MGSTASTFRRIIPACAGNSMTSLMTTIGTSDHPRVCGEQFGFKGRKANFFGSSPRVRGTAPLRTAPLRSARIIPACAGNRSQERPEGRQSSDHPRVCGEQAPRDRRRADCVGSSPRVRGTGARNRPHAPLHRIIPACAGNSAHRQTAHDNPSDHPRVCGEQACICRISRTSNGSSPRVRGTGYFECDFHVLFRIIPACAGNSTSQDRID